MNGRGRATNGDAGRRRAVVGQALALPAGDLLVIGAGLFILGAGVDSFARAFLDHFGRDLECEDATAGWLGGLARAGHAARGIALAPAGLLLVSAGLNTRAADARGLWAFGAFAIVEGWQRPIRMPRAA